MTHECLCILRFSNQCCSIAAILWSGLSEIIPSKSSDTRSLMAECQKYQEGANLQTQSLANTTCSRVMKLGLPVQV